MIEIRPLLPGVTLRCVTDQRFKHGFLSLQLVRPLCREEAAMNALLPAVLLRGSRTCPDLRDITLRLDDLYGASISTLVRRGGDYQTTGLYASFLEDRFAMEGDAVFAGTVEFLRELLLEPVTQQGIFREDYVESEKKNLIATIEAQYNDKQAYAMSQMMRRMCAADPLGIPRLGEPAWVKEITAQALYTHYRRILRESRMELCYVGAQSPETVEQAALELLRGIDRNYVNLPEQTAFRPSPEGEYSQAMEVSQGKLCMGFVTPHTIRDGDFAAAQVWNLVFGGGMTSKLFLQIREKLSLCYAIGSAYQGTKGILTVSAGIDDQQEKTVRREILQQLELCRRGQITQEELDAAKQAMRSSLLAVHDSPGAMESYYAGAALSGLKLSPAEYIREVEQVTVERVAQVAKDTTLHTVYFLKGVDA